MSKEMSFLINSAIGAQREHWYLSQAAQKYITTYGQINMIMSAVSTGPNPTSAYVRGRVSGRHAVVGGKVPRARPHVLPVWPTTAFRFSLPATVVLLFCNCVKGGE